MKPSLWMCGLKKPMPLVCQGHEFAVLSQTRHHTGRRGTAKSIIKDVPTIESKHLGLFKFWVLLFCRKPSFWDDSAYCFPGV